MAGKDKNERAAAAVGRIPSGVAILTAAHGGQTTGMLASWVQQASFEPLMVSISVKKDRPIETLIDGSGKFLLNLLGENPKDMFKHFGRGFPLDEDAFAGLPVHTREAGIHIESAVAHLGCQVAAKVEAGDHWLYLGRVIGGDADLDATPHVHIRKSGLSY